MNSTQFLDEQWKNINGNFVTKLVPQNMAFILETTKVNDYLTFALTTILQELTQFSNNISDVYTIGNLQMGNAETK